MQGIRALIHRYHMAALGLALLALCIKAIIPAGHMIGPSETRSFDIILCSDPTGMAVAQKLVIPFDVPEEQQSAQKAKGDCAFTALGHGALPLTDPALLLAAIAFILALGFARLPAPSLRGIPYIRPPLRGPPALV